MKNFRVQIHAYGYTASFNIKSKDTLEDVEQAILDKLGENVIKWESSGMFRDIPYRITYEEVSNDTRPLQSKKVLGVEVGTGASI